MKKIFLPLGRFFKKEPMLLAALLAAALSFLITPPSARLLQDIDWKTLAVLFMLLSVLDGFKHENLFLPVIRLSSRLKTGLSLSFFMVYGVFFSSMFVTNDVSLIIFVPLTILLFKGSWQEKYLLPVLAMENVAAVRGSLLTPFGSPQNLFLFSRSGIGAGDFLLMMLPLWLGSLILIALFLLFIYRGQWKRAAVVPGEGESWEASGRARRAVYLFLFAAVLATIVTRTDIWPFVTLGVAVLLFIFDRQVFRRVDYVLLLTFLCFFVFSSSVAANGSIAAFLHKAVAGKEYWWSIGLSQLISNVPAAIVLWPFTENLKALIYGLDTAGLVTIIGSLASLINLRLYTREYPGQGGRFLVAFEKVSLAFFLPVVLLQLLLL